MTIRTRLYCCGGLTKLYYNTTLSPPRSTHSFPATYVIEHLPTGRVYVGSSGDLYTRLNKHRRSLERGAHRNPEFQSLVESLSELSVSYTPMDTREEALSFEQMLLTELNNTDGLLVNIGLDVKSVFKGRTHNEETRSLLRERTTEHFSDSKSRLRHSERLKKKWRDPEYRKKHEGKKLDLSTKKSISARLKSAWSDPERRKRIIDARAIPVTVDGVVYKNLPEASKRLGIPKTTLFDRIKRSKENG